MIGLAILLQVLGSFLFAGGAALQSLGVRSTFDDDTPASDNRLSVGGMLKLVLIPKWSLGLLCVLLGAAINFAALTLAPIAVVQPIGIVAVIWSVLLAARIHKHRISGHLWIAVLVTFVGLVGFTVISTRNATGNQEASLVSLLVTFGVVVAISLGVSAITPRVTPWLKAMLWSSIGAMLYGMATGMLKATADMVLTYHEPWLDVKVLVAIGLMVVGFLGGVWMIQQGYASGPAEITVATMTTVDPVVAVLFGLVVLAEGAHMGVWAGIGMTVMGAVAIYGVVMLSHYHPDAIKERAERKRREAADESATN